MTSQTTNPNPNHSPSPRLWMGKILLYLIIPLVLFLCAGDFGWWQAWVYGVLLFCAGVGGRVLAERRHPGILVERVNMEKAQDSKRWDKYLAPLMAVSLTFPILIVAGLDHRYGWTPLFAGWVNVLGLGIIAFGYAFATWALVENRFFATTVRIQTERGHSVCDSGPYRFVRHPGYAGNLLAVAGIIMALGSLWTLIPAVLALVIAVIRTSLEDRTLHEELPGYPEYAGRVRYRLFPGIY